MQTADWALLIAICSVAISLAGFVWNVWSKFIQPRPRVAVSIGFIATRPLEPNKPKKYIASLRAANLGPGPVTLRVAMVRSRRSWRRRFRRRYALLTPIQYFAVWNGHPVGSNGGRLPTKLEVGEEWSVHFRPDYEELAKDEYERIGFADTFGRHHWASKQSLRETRTQIQDYRREHPPAADKQTPTADSKPTQAGIAPG